MHTCTRQQKSSHKKVHDAANIRAHGSVVPRISVRDYFYGDHKQERDLFLRAFSAFENNSDTNDPWSYFAIAGIHGLPIRRYDPTDASPDERAWGYCEHEAKDKCRDVAESLRVPYFDWESKETNGEVPDVFTEEKIKVKYPYKTEQSIDNPLFSYVLPIDLKKNSDVSNPTNDDN
ncbi:unnamed protein product [Didymodactylos carnosus]|uniref:Tyrosinase copper-binding domain-containing protein n=1 Tax=Didymodactylos carnosus TaxID=1234261 RepID=A0A814YW27_9BILA|nr:unnamed protein product [Didymodactylos carnosus]CAF3996611.1 unnamed protein product [Didymodactylos carnosus]